MTYSSPILLWVAVTKYLLYILLSIQLEILPALVIVHSTLPSLTTGLNASTLFSLNPASRLMCMVMANLLQAVVSVMHARWTLLVRWISAHSINLIPMSVG